MAHADPPRREHGHELEPGHVNGHDQVNQHDQVNGHRHEPGQERGRAGERSHRHVNGNEREPGHVNDHHVKPHDRVNGHRHAHESESGQLAHRRDRGHDHGDGHRTLWLANPAPSRAVHRIGRRQFLTELGRNTFAVAVLGGVIAACSGDDDGDDGDVDGGNGGDGGAEATTTSGPDDASGAANASDDSADSAAGGLRWAQANLGFVSAYVLVRGNEAAVVDTGSAGSADQIGEALATLGVTYDDVRHVVLTHAHGDHVGSLAAVLDRAGAARPYAGAADIPNITSPVDVTAVGDGDDVFGLQVISTPGHTPGSISVFDPGIGLLVAGDAINGNDDGTGLSGANERFSADMATAGESIRKLAALDVDAVAVGHGQPVAAGAGPLLTALAAEL